MPTKDVVAESLNMIAASLGRKKGPELTQQIDALALTLSQNARFARLSKPEFAQVSAIAATKSNYLPTAKDFADALTEWTEQSRKAPSQDEAQHLRGCPTCKGSGSLSILVVDRHPDGDWTAQEYGARCTCEKAKLFAGLPCYSSFQRPGREVYTSYTLTERRELLKLPPIPPRPTAIGSKGSGFRGTGNVVSFPGGRK